MILINPDFQQFAKEIKEHDRQIVLFGAGTVLTTWGAYMLEAYNLMGNVRFVIDNSHEKIGSEFYINGRRFVITDLNKTVSDISSEKMVILITSSYFAGIIDQLDDINELDDVICCIAPVMYNTHHKQTSGDFRIYSKDKPQIPKVIHYTWFSDEPMPEKYKECVESWKKYCPDYEIIKWDTHNYDVGKNKYMSQAFDAGKYGSVADYARLDILYENGGIYLDTDVELIKNIDELLYLQGFISFEEYPTVNFGTGCGSMKGLSVLKDILDFRKDMAFINADGSYNMTSSGYFDTEPLRRRGLKLDGTLQNIDGLTVLPSHYMNPRSFISGRTNITPETFSIHYYGWSWQKEGKLTERDRTQKEFEKILIRMER